MRCPRCKGNNAFLFCEDGITDIGEHYVEIKCPECTESDYGVGATLPDSTIYIA